MTAADHNARYGEAHRRVRRRVARDVQAGVAVCVRCGGPLAAGSDWHLDHRDDGDGYLGPAHAGCNVRAANERRARLAKAAIAAGLDRVSEHVRPVSRCWEPGNATSRCLECRTRGVWLCKGEGAVRDGG